MNDHQQPLLTTDNSRPLTEAAAGINPRYGIFSLVTFSWLTPLVVTGHKKALDLEEDVPHLYGVDSVKGSFPVFKNYLETPNHNRLLTTFGLVKALIHTTWKDILLTAFLAVLYTLASYVGPYLIDAFVQFLNGNRHSKLDGYLFVFIFFLAKLVESVSQRHWFFNLQKGGIRARAALVAIIYQKGLALSTHSKIRHSSGEITNLIAIDAERVNDFAWYIHDIWLAILQVGLALAILYRNLGIASLAALVAIGIILLANIPLGSLQEKFQDQLMTSKDTRMKTTSELLTAMRILKLQGWEMKFLSKIFELRSLETKWLKMFLCTSTTIISICWVAPTFIAAVTFVTCMVLGTPLEPGKLLSAIATFKLLQQPIYNLPDTVSMISQVKVSLDRITSYLNLDDLDSNLVETFQRSSSNVAIRITNGSFSWSGEPTLSDINIQIFHGMKVAVCGTVASGKSSLLSCVLGEVPKVSGSVYISGTKAYVAQSPWIQSGKIEENILFGKDMDRVRYDKVLDACALKKDLEILPFGDQTVIGERGINLSGGQKQRLQIARALYQDADNYLFDDPFSAVDAHTGSHLFKECLLEFLESKTVIYVTHQVEFLPMADLILVLKSGRIVQAGNYNDILNSGSAFMELVGAHNEALSIIDSIETSSKSENTKVIEKGMVDVESNDTKGTKTQIIQKEEREKGSVGFSIYCKYITSAFGGALVPCILLAAIIFEVVQVASTYWLAWASPVSEDMVPPVKGSTLIVVYVGLAIGSTFCIFGRAMCLTTAGYKTANLLFHEMHLCIFRAPMSFFDATPSGRILNRVSTDQSAVDLTIPNSIGAFAFALVQLLAVIALMCQISWQVFLVFIPIITICIWLQQYHISSARELARLVGVHKAPIIQHFSETVSGLTTIRSSNQQQRFQDTNMKLIDAYSRPKFHSAAAIEWLSFRVQMLSLVIFAFCLVFLLIIPNETFDPTIAGLVVTYGLNLNNLQASMIWKLCNMENSIISVERILQYTSIPSEAPLVESKRPNDLWPSHGEVDIHDLQVRYAPHMPLVLRGLTCTFHGGTKTGIVGRTGSGKSTLMQTLFRIVEPSRGEIFIDEINISSIGLHDLRSRLSIIPQDPTMFQGSVRSNLDPLEQYTEEEIWELGDEVRTKEGKLDSVVDENGENWSMGQRQLVCLGRVLLKRSKILVLDEATASVDTSTDNKIHQTLAKHFSDSTVITIAHRITSVLKGDMVLVLEQGLIEEYDSPLKLLENKSSSFAKLVAEYRGRSGSSYGT
uniref:ABC transporter C family member 3-like isoform X2 n=1 Tax=Erigeron canadensis TaxID=72917 RepID=UPI001CB8F08B|nr:ABC transporter C family member 3-like isoform X2 [Erigeron canadensis]